MGINVNDLIHRGTAVVLLAEGGEAVSVPLADFTVIPDEPACLLPAPASPLEAAGDNLRALMAELG